MSNYYYLVAGLPDVAFDGSRPTFSVERFREEIEPHLSAADASCVNLFFLSLDNANILSLLRKGEEAREATMNKMAPGMGGMGGLF